MNARFNKLVGITIAVTIGQIASAGAVIPDVVRPQINNRIETEFRSLPVATPVISIVIVADQVPVPVVTWMGSGIYLDIYRKASIITQDLTQPINMKEHLIGKPDLGIDSVSQVISDNSVVLIQQVAPGTFCEVAEVIANTVAFPTIGSESFGQILTLIPSAIISTAAFNAPDRSSALT